MISGQNKQRDLISSLSEISSFLDHAIHIAREKGTRQLISLVLKAENQDLLSLAKEQEYFKNEHFYYENPLKEEAHLAVGYLLSKSFEGSNRFIDSAKWVESLKENIISTNSNNTYVFNGFTFYDDRKSIDYPFAPGFVFIPKIHIYKLLGYYSVTINAFVDESTDVEKLASEIFETYQKTLNHQSSFTSSNPEVADSIKTHAILDQEDETFRFKVQNVVSQINEGAYQKLVLARALNAKLKNPIDLGSTLNFFRDKYKSCHIFSYGKSNEAVFTGASPELLLEIDEHKMYLEALAGTSLNSKSSEEHLLKSEKDKEEHDYVVEFIKQQLDTLGIPIKNSSDLHLFKLKNIQHLKKSFEGERPLHNKFLDIVSALHPTPAVSGYPYSKVITESIYEIEGFDRGLYTGAIGFFNIEGMGKEFVVLRAALIQKNEATLYAGGGIVKGSDPDLELQETKSKASTFLEALIAQNLI